MRPVCSDARPVCFQPSASCRVNYGLSSAPPPLPFIPSFFLGVCSRRLRFLTFLSSKFPLRGRFPLPTSRFRKACRNDRAFTEVRFVSAPPFGCNCTISWFLFFEFFGSFIHIVVPPSIDFSRKVFFSPFVFSSPRSPMGGKQLEQVKCPHLTTCADQPVPTTIWVLALSPNNLFFARRGLAPDLPGPSPLSFISPPQSVVSGTFLAIDSPLPKGRYNPHSPRDDQIFLA